MNKKETPIVEKIWDLTQDNSKQLSDIKSHVAVLNEEMGGVKLSINEIKDEYVNQKEFSPVKKIVYGAVGTILLTVLAALLALVISNAR